MTVLDQETRSSQPQKNVAYHKPAMDVGPEKHQRKKYRAREVSHANPADHPDQQRHEHEGEQLRPFEIIQVNDHQRSDAHENYPGEVGQALPGHLEENSPDQESHSGK